MDRLMWPECMAYTIAGFNALDIFLWGHMKSLLYQTSVDTVENLLAQVLGTAQEIQKTPGVMEPVYQNMSRRRNELGGRHIEPLL